jgi:biopolymer transport protein ExbD
MRFTSRKRRQPPAVIIISLIDILIVLLIFLMVTTTFRQQPAVKLALPESKQSEKGASEGTVVVTVAKTEPHLFLGTRPITLDRLQQELATNAVHNPELALSIRADMDAPFGQIVRVMDAAKAARIKRVMAAIKVSGSP